MIRIDETFTSKADAEMWAEAYKRSYHPCGYGTYLVITQVEHLWRVTGYRSHSCD